MTSAMSPMVRGLAAAAVVTVLAGVAGCKEDEDSGGGVAPPPVSESAENGETSSNEAGDTLASIFPGEGSGGGGSASPINLPTAKVNEPASGTVEIGVSPNEPPETLQGIKGDTDTGSFEIIENNCPRMLQPGKSCRIKVQHTASEPGPYTGQLTVTTTDGDTITAPISGEAVGDGTTASSVQPTTTQPTTTQPPPPTETENWTTELPDETDIPVPDEEDIP